MTTNKDDELIIKISKCFDDFEESLINNFPLEDIESINVDKLKRFFSLGMLQIFPMATPKVIKILQAIFNVRAPQILERIKSRLVH